MTLTLSVRLGGAALAFTALWALWSQGAPSNLAVEKITGHLYVIASTSFSSGNVAVLPTSEGVILVDDKFSQDAPAIVARVKSLTGKPIRYILNTHQHADHTGGNEAMLAASAEIIMHKNARANMAAQNQPGLSRVTFSEETQVFLGGMEVRARHFGPGHTNGDAVIYFPSERVIHMGDLFLIGLPPLIDYDAGGSIKAWDKTLEAALQYDFDKVIPGHGPVATRADLIAWQRNIAIVRTRAKEACAGGSANAAKLLKLDDLGMRPFGVFDERVPRLCQELSN